MRPMKRFVAASLWFFVGWYLGTAAAWLLAFSPSFGPILAVALAGIVFADPRAAIWLRDRQRRSQTA